MTYQPDFSGIWAKIERAEEHRKILESEIGWASDETGIVIPENYRIPMRLEYEPETGQHVFRATATLPEDAIRRCGVLIGDIVHNLRSALDHLVWQLVLVRSNGEIPWTHSQIREIQFPITDTPERFNGNQALKYITPEHRTIIEEHQPYGSRFDYSYLSWHPLTRLRKLSNTDKHRVITPVTVLSNRHSGYQELFYGAGAEAVELHLPDHLDWSMKENAEVVRVNVRPASLQLNMEMAGFVAPNVFLPDSVPEHGVAFRPVSHEFNDIISNVLAVISDFHELSY